MKKIHRKYLPMDMPITGTVLWWLFLDRISAPGWAFGVVGTLLVIVWIAFFVEAYRSDLGEPWK